MLKTFLILAASSLTACTHLKPYPMHKVYDIDLAHKVCGEYEIVNRETLKFKHVRDLPLSECDGLLGLKARDFPKVKNWALDAQKFVKDHCR